MKHLLKFSLIFFFAQATLALEIKEPEVVPSAPTGVYAPQGFDTNDNVEIFFEGRFGNTCSKSGLTFHTIDEESKRIYITDTAHYFGEAFCAQVSVPYQKEIQAGFLSPGEYRVFFRHSRGNFVEEAFLPINEATSSDPDDYLYAPIKSVQYFPSDESKPSHLKLRGEFTNTCMKLDYVKVVPNLENNVVDVLPIAIMDRGGCKAEEPRPFEHDVDLSQLNSGRVLLHVRSLNGQSVNEIVTVR